MDSKIRLLSTDFDGTLVAHGSDPVLDRDCMELIRDMQRAGAVWAINTGRSVDLLESGLTDFGFAFRPDFIVTSERDVFRPCNNGARWEPFGDWNDRCAREHAEIFTSAASVLSEVVRFVSGNVKAGIIYDGIAPVGIVTETEEEMHCVTRFLDEARAAQPKFSYQRNTVYLRFCHADYHKGAALAELARLIAVPREQTFAAGDHHNDISMLDGRFAAFPACPDNAIAEVKEAVRKANGYVAARAHGAGVYEALLHFTS